MTDSEQVEYYAGVYRDVVSTHNGNNIHDTVDIQTQHKRARFQFARVEKYVSHVKTMLEIGCSLGYFMDQMNMYYDVECIGIEADRRYHQADPAKRFELYADISECPPRKVDLIVLSHVLEHMNHPYEYMSQLAFYYGHENTLFLIEVPNVDELPTTITLNHPLGFTKDTLNNFMARIGFVPVYFKKHGLGSDKGIYLLGVYKRA
jgi:hypothetical protein